VLGTTEYVFDIVPSSVKTVELIPDKTQIVATGSDNVMIQSVLKDVNGNVVTSSTQTVVFSISGEAGAWTDGHVGATMVAHIGGVATISLRSTTRAGSVNVIATVMDGSVELASTTIQLTSVAQPDPRKVVLNFKQGASSNIPADGLSETLIESSITDYYGNKLDDANNTVVFNLTGEGDIVSGTQPVKRVYLQSDHGTCQVKLRARTQAGTLVLAADSAGLDSSSITVITAPGYPSKFSFLLAGINSADVVTSLAADGRSKLRLITSVMDTNNNVITGYTGQVSFTISGPGSLETPLSVIPVNGMTESVISSKLETGNVTITAHTGVIAGTKTIPVVPALTKKLNMTFGTRTLYTMSITTITVTVTDEFNNRVIIDSTQTVTLSGAGTAFRLAAGTGSYTSADYTFDMSTNEVRVACYVTQAGVTKITCSAVSMISDSEDVIVTAVQSVDRIKIYGSTIAYVPGTVNLTLSFVDSNNNAVTDETVTSYVHVVATNSFNEIIMSTDVKLVNGTCSLSLFIPESSVYTITCDMPGIKPGLIRIAGMTDKTRDHVSRINKQYGTVKLTVPKNTINRDVVFELNSVSRQQAWPVRIVSDTIINITAKDQDGTVLPDTGLVNPAKYVTLTIPYPDTNQDGIIDGTNIPEQNAMIVQLIGNSWQMLSTVKPLNSQLSTLNSQLDFNQNTVSVNIDRFGTYAIIAYGTDPTISSLVVYPNPFTKSTVFMFDIGSPGEVKIDIYTVSGRLIKTLSKQVGQLEVGYTQVMYDGTDNQDQQIANGTYIYKVTTTNNGKKCSKTGKFVKLE
jgi:hypothetical protein